MIIPKITSGEGGKQNGRLVGQLIKLRGRIVDVDDVDADAGDVVRVEPRSAAILHGDGELYERQLFAIQRHQGAHSARVRVDGEQQRRLCVDDLVGEQGVDAGIAIAGRYHQRR